jgi:transposase
MRRAIEIRLNDVERKTLKGLKSGRRVAVRLAERAAIVLHAADGLENREIGALMGITRQKAGRWRSRYAAQGLAGIEKDAPRPGRRRRIDEKQRAAVIRKTLKKKPEGQTHWSRATMSAATGLSESTIGRIWREHGLKPHRVETFKLSNDPRFVEKLNDIVGLYLNPPEHAIVLSCDEKSQIQALDRTQPGLPMKKGRCGTLTHDYKRNGTTSLFAAMNVLDGTIISQCQSRHRHQEWLKFLNVIKKNVPPDLDVHLVMDNYITHKNERAKRWLLRNPRFHIHFIPTHSSWLNMVESWFSLLSKRKLKRGVHCSTQALERDINDFIGANNDDPTPYVWTKSAEEILDSLRRYCQAVNA